MEIGQRIKTQNGNKGLVVEILEDICVIEQDHLPMIRGCNGWHYKRLIVDIKKAHTI